MTVRDAKGKLVALRLLERVETVVSDDRFPGISGQCGHLTQIRPLFFGVAVAGIAYEFEGDTPAGAHHVAAGLLQATGHRRPDRIGNSPCGCDRIRCGEEQVVARQKARGEEDGFGA